MRSRFDEQLDELNDALITMGAQCERAIAGAARALVDQDFVLAEAIVKGDDAINQQEREIERLCLTLLLQQQPVARDLRLISTALKMITDLERIGDQAADIAEIVIAARIPVAQCAPPIVEMARACVAMVTASVDAFVRRDLDTAHEVIHADDRVDSLFNDVRFDLLEFISANGQNAAHALDLLMIAKYLERIGDHAVNVAEWVEFSLTGTHKGDLQC